MQRRDQARSKHQQLNQELNVEFLTLTNSQLPSPLRCTSEPCDFSIRNDLFLTMTWAARMWREQFFSAIRRRGAALYVAMLIATSGQPLFLLQLADGQHLVQLAEY